MAVNSLLVFNSSKVQHARRFLEGLGYYDKSRRIMAVAEGHAIPLTDRGVAYLSKVLRPEGDPGVIGEHLGAILELFTVSECALAHVENLPKSKKALSGGRREGKQLLVELRKKLAEIKDLELSGGTISQLVAEVPCSWERHSDLVVLPKGSFANPLWQTLGWKVVWETVSKTLRCGRVAVDGGIASNGFRSSTAQLVLGEDGWVEHIDNGVKYVFDVTKCMFSSGNVSEKIRVGGLDCSGETVVDLYAGIGYFTLPFLIHSGARMVHACEWNPHAVEALKRGLFANGVADSCTIHFGDNRKVAPRRVADRVNLGLLPSSEPGWPVACAVLRPDTGGMLHVHGNVSTKPDSPAPFREGNLCESPDTQGFSGKLEGPDHDNCEALASSSSQVSASDGFEDTHSSLRKLPTCRNADVDHQHPPSVRWRWGAYVAARMRELLPRENPLTTGQQWTVELRHVERVKSYAPHVDHLVADIECRPVLCAGH